MKGLTDIERQLIKLVGEHNSRPCYGSVPEDSKPWDAEFLAAFYELFRRGLLTTYRCDNCTALHIELSGDWKTVLSLDDAARKLELI